MPFHSLACFSVGGVSGGSNYTVVAASLSSWLIGRWQDWFDPISEPLDTDRLSESALPDGVLSFLGRWEPQCLELERFVYQWLHSGPQTPKSSVSRGQSPVDDEQRFLR